MICHTEEEMIAALSKGIDFDIPDTLRPEVITSICFMSNQSPSLEIVSNGELIDAWALSIHDYANSSGISNRV